MKPRLNTDLILLGILCFLLTVIGQHSYPPNECTGAIKSCAECIQKNTKCMWCKDKKYQDDNAYPPRCDFKKNHEKRGCKAISDPPSNYSSVGSKTNSRVFPNNITVNLRPGRPTEVKIKLKTPKNFPVDLYYLMDLSASMADDKEKILNLGQELADKMKNITSNFRLGFGAFVDKPLAPYTFTDPDEIKKKLKLYQKTFGFTNYLPLDQNVSKFKLRVDAAKISYNIDEPEGSLDALMQVVACHIDIGWRPKTLARRIVILTTDATFHYAGDGLLGGVVTPNDGQCYLQNQKYTASSKMDYPSLSYLRSKMSQAEILPIFATTGNNELYKEVATFFGAGSVADKLAEDSSNVVPLIAKAYNQIAKYVKVEADKVNGIDAKVTSNCGTGATKTDKPNECSNVTIGEGVEFTVSLTAKSCNNELKKVKTFKIKTTFEDVIVNLKLVCNCECESPDHKIVNTSVCNFKGDQTCGKCVCNKAYSGRFCQCDAKTNQNKSLCRRTPADEVCSGRGECDCGECVSCVQPAGRLYEQIYGKYCECSNATCGRSFGLICGGPTRGRCDCNKCICNRDWTGPTCGEKCINSTAGCMKDGKMCNGIGECICGKCTQCSRQYTGDFCEQCVENCPDPCVDYRECVRCKVFQTSNLKGADCENECRLRNVTKITKVDSVEQGIGERCVSSDKDDCSFVFTHRKDNVTKEIELLVRKERICPAEPDILAIILGVIAGIVGVGLALLLIWKLLATIQDRREFAKFDKDRQNAKWDTGENPIFKQATSTFKNPLYGGDTQS